MKTIAIAIALCATSCMATFPSLQKKAVADYESRTSELGASEERCNALDDNRRFWGGLAKGSAFLAGGGGIAAIAVQDDDLKTVQAAGVIVTAGLAIVSTFLSESNGDSWVRECSVPSPLPSFSARPAAAPTK